MQVGLGKSDAVKLLPVMIGKFAARMVISTAVAAFSSSANTLKDQAISDYRSADYTIERIADLVKLNFGEIGRE